MNKYNIIWIVVDGIRNYATNVDELGKLKIMDEIEKEAVYFHNVITSAPSTIMAVSAMMTSVPAYYIGRDYDSFKYNKNNFTLYKYIYLPFKYGLQ
jgi:DNA polymerase II small subunit/DNA polymerase delta subunit B